MSLKCRASVIPTIVLSCLTNDLAALDEDEKAGVTKRTVGIYRGSGQIELW